MRGFILINTIYIISLMALLILTLQNNLQLDIKSVNHLSILQSNFHALESAALEIMQDLALNNSTDKCILDNEQGLLAYKNIILDGCKSSQNDIYYTVTDLGNFVCLRTVIDGNNLATHHYILNIVHKNLPSKILQIRYALPSKNLLCQSSVSRYIVPGIISWNLRHRPV